MTTVKYHKCPPMGDHVHIERTYNVWGIKNDLSGDAFYGLGFCPYCGTQLEWDSPFTETIGDD